MKFDLCRAQVEFNQMVHEKGISGKYSKYFNPFRANPEKWSNTLKQIVGKLPTICLSVFDHFMNLALKGLMRNDVNNRISLHF